MRTRNIKKNFWLNAEEDAALKEKSKRCGIDEAVLLRMLILGFEPRERPDEKFYNVVRNLTGIAGRLNQLAIKSHTYDYIDTEELNKSIAEVREMIVKMQKYFLLPKESELWQQQDSGK